MYLLVPQRTPNVHISSNIACCWAEHHWQIQFYLRSCRTLLHILKIDYQTGYCNDWAACDLGFLWYSSCSQSLVLFSRSVAKENHITVELKMPWKLCFLLLYSTFSTSFSILIMSRQVPWRRICPDVVCHRIEQANQARIYLLRETGPTGFLLKEDGNDKKFKVSLKLCLNYFIYTV